MLLFQNFHFSFPTRKQFGVLLFVCYSFTSTDMVQRVLFQIISLRFAAWWLGKKTLFNYSLGERNWPTKQKKVRRVNFCKSNFFYPFLLFSQKKYFLFFLIITKSLSARFFIYPVSWKIIARRQRSGLNNARSNTLKAIRRLKT